MDSKDNLVPLDIARELAYTLCSKTSVEPNGTAFLDDCGLYSSQYNNAYYNFDESYLYIKDHRKWMLARIKYGI